jgi:hypothetical protein
MVAANSVAGTTVAFSDALPTMTIVNVEFLGPFEAQLVSLHDPSELSYQVKAFGDGRSNALLGVEHQRIDNGQRRDEAAAELGIREWS